MDYSAINHVIYRIKLAKEMFVIGGKFAAGLCEPTIAKIMSGGDHIHLYTSSSNFEILKGYDEPRMHVELDGDLLIFRQGTMRITFERGLPYHWVTNSGYLVMDPLPLKHWLERNDYGYLAVKLNDVPFPKRMEGWDLTEDEKAFKEECSRHDWYSDYSDDHSVVKNAKVGLNVLLARRDVLGGKAGEIFTYYANK